MNKQILIGIIAAAIILLGGVGAFLYSKNKPAQNPPTTSTSENQSGQTMSDNLLGLLSSGKTQQCTFDSSDPASGGINGTVYLSGNKMRGDFKIATEGSQVNQISMIRNGDDNYIWGEGFPGGTGIKMTLSMDEYTSDAESKKYFDPTQKVEYKCDSWVVDSSVFTPPSNVKFSDISEMMKVTPSASNCSICNSLTGDAKTSCLAQLNCQ